MGNITYDFTGKSVIVTGAARGIGQALARHFVEAKAAVFMVDFDEIELDKAARDVGAVGEPYRTYDPVPLKDFPVPGVSGYECQWEWRSPQGDIRNLKVDALSFSGAMEGALDASWKGTVDTLSAKGTPREDLGEEAISAKLQGLVTLSAREGDWQITSVASSQGEASPASVEALARVTAVLLKAANEGN